MRRANVIVMAATFGMLSAGALAQQSGTESSRQPSTGQQSSQKQSSQQSSVLRATELMGKKVSDKQGQELGEIQDFAVDLQQGKLAYVVVSTGGMMGGKEVGVPTETIQPAPDGEGYVADVSMEQLESAEELPKENLPQQPSISARGQSGGAGGKSSGQKQDFASLDRNSDGYISQSEGSGSELQQEWDQIDRNADDRIDRSEFAVFEAQQQ